MKAICGTCRFAKPWNDALFCERIVRPKEGIETGAEGTSRIDVWMAPWVPYDNVKVKLNVLPTFGCLLWEEP